MTQSILENSTKGRKLTDRQRQGLQNYIDRGYTDVKEAFLDAGYPPDGVHQAIRSLRKEIIDLAENILLTSAPVAAHTINNVMTSEEGVTQAANKLDAAKTVLDRVGLGKQEKIDHNVNMSGGLMILPAKRPLEE